MSEKITFQKWGYSKEGAKLFTVEKGKEKLPKGYYESPANVPQDKNEDSSK